MMKKRYLVTILNRGHIPGIGNGPIRRPVSISEEKYESLLKLGYRVNLVADKNKKVESLVETVKEEVVVTKVEEQPQEIVKPSLVETVKEETVEPAVVEEPKKEIIEEEPAKEEVLDEDVILPENDPNFAHATQTVYTRKFLTSATICRKILNARMVQYEETASAAMLKSLVINSNPVLEEETTEEN